jgi:hypothetical protein
MFGFKVRKLVKFTEEIQCSVVVTASTSLVFEVRRTSVDDARFGLPSRVIWDEV